MSENKKQITPQFIYETVAKYPVHEGGPDGSYRTHDWVYDEILKHVQAGDTTLETGAGVSTLFFAHSSAAKHICVMPVQKEVDDLRVTAKEIGISLDKVQFHVESSGHRMPLINEKLDFALVDGCHGPFLPFLDFFFAAKNLKPGGIIIVDDIQLIAPKIMFEFLRTEKAVEVLHRDERAAMLKIHNNEFLEYDWGYSGIDYIAENKEIITPELLATFDKLNP